MERDPSLTEPLLAAIGRMLRPLARLLIRRGLTFPIAAELLRAAYLDAARDMLPDERARTDSRLSLMTGIHRKELRRHRDAAPAAPVPAPATVGSQVIGRWLGQDGFQDAAGDPVPLARSGAAPSFEALVVLVTRDVRPRALLDEWLDAGLVTLDGSGRVVLQSRAFLPKPGEAEQLYFLGRNLHDHLAAAVANVEGEGSFLERAVHYDGLSAEAAARLEAVGREAASRMLIEVNRAALSIAEADDRAAAERAAEGQAAGGQAAGGLEADGPGRPCRVNVGSFVFRTAEA